MLMPTNFDVFILSEYSEVKSQRRQQQRSQRQGHNSTVLWWSISINKFETLWEISCGLTDDIVVITEMDKYFCNSDTTSEHYKPMT